MNTPYKKKQIKSNLSNKPSETDTEKEVKFKKTYKKPKQNTQAKETNENQSNIMDIDDEINFSSQVQLKKERKSSENDFSSEEEDDSYEEFSEYDYEDEKNDENSLSCSDYNENNGSSYRKTSTQRKKEKIKKNYKDDNDNKDIVEDVFDCTSTYNTVLLDLPCRAKEQLEIEDFIKKGLDTNGCYGSLYISGMPGTGKTASVMASIRKLTNSSRKKNIKEFNCLLINGMKVTNNNSVYKQIYSHLFKKEININPIKCSKLLDDFFKNRTEFNFNTTLKDSRNLHLLLIIDEIDCLCDKKMSLLYNLFNWSTFPNSKLIIISISNTIDLPQRVLPKISSRMGNKQIPFKPYERDQLVKILQETLPNFKSFSTDAILLCCSKVASISGDIRRIIAICKYAEDNYNKRIMNFEYNKEKLKSKKEGVITMSDIKSAINNLYDKKIENLISSLKLYEKLCILSVYFETNLSSKVNFGLVYKRFIYCCNKQSVFRPSYEEFKYIIINLYKIKLFSLDENLDNLLSSSIKIEVYHDELLSALDDDVSICKIMDELRQI